MRPGLCSWSVAVRAGGRLLAVPPCCFVLCPHLHKKPTHIHGAAAPAIPQSVQVLRALCGPGLVMCRRQALRLTARSGHQRSIDRRGCNNAATHSQQCLCKSPLLQQVPGACWPWVPWLPRAAASPQRLLGRRRPLGTFGACWRGAVRWSGQLQSWIHAPRATTSAPPVLFSVKFWAVSISYPGAGASSTRASTHASSTCISSSEK